MLFAEVPWSVELRATLERNGAGELHLFLFGDGGAARGIPITVSDALIMVGDVRVPISQAESRQPIDLQLFFDRSTLEVFFLSGRYVVTSVHYLSPDCTAIAATARGGRAWIRDAELSHLSGVW